MSSSFSCENYSRTQSKLLREIASETYVAAFDVPDHSLYELITVCDDSFQQFFTCLTQLHSSHDDPNFSFIALTKGPTSSSRTMLDVDADVGPNPNAFFALYCASLEPFRINETS